MAYVFDKVRLLGYSHVPVFFENGTRYKVRKNLKIQGTFYVPGQDSGVGATWQKAEALLAGAKDYDDVILNNVYFGIGKITNISFDEGDHVVKQNYSFDLECYEEVDVASTFLTGGKNGPCPDIDPRVAALIDKVEESLTYDIDNAGNQTYTQTATVRFNQQANGVNTDDYAAPGLNLSTNGLAGAIASAEALIESLFGLSVQNLDAIGAISKNFERLSTVGNATLTKSYNLVDGQVSFTRKVTIPVGDAGDYSVSFAYEIHADANNVSTVSEKATIKGLTSYPYSSAAGQVVALSNNSSILARIGQVFQAYTAFAVHDQAFISYGDLSPHPVSKSITSDIFRGTFEISSTFTNDPRYSNPSTNQPAPVSYVSSTQIDLNEDGVTEITEQGTITGLGSSRTAIIPSDRYRAAMNFYSNSVKDAAMTRVTKGSNGKKNILTKSSYTGSELDGIVQYSFTATDLSDFSDGELAGTKFRRSSVETTVSMPVAMTQTYNVLNTKQIIQPQQQSTVGVVNMVVKLRGCRAIKDAGTYLTKAKGIANTYVGDSTHKLSTLIGSNALAYLKSASYSLSPNTNDFTLNLSWNFFPGTEVPFGTLTLA